MSAIEEPEPGSEPGGPARPSDELEHWLSDLRTDVAADPSGWISEDAAGEQPADQAADQAAERSPRDTDAARPSSGGRHRAAD